MSHAIPYATNDSSSRRGVASGTHGSAYTAPHRESTHVPYSSSDSKHVIFHHIATESEDEFYDPVQPSHLGSGVSFPDELITKAVSRSSGSRTLPVRGRTSSVKRSQSDDELVRPKKEDSEDGEDEKRRKTKGAFAAGRPT